MGEKIHGSTEVLCAFTPAASPIGIVGAFRKTRKTYIKTLNKLKLMFESKFQSFVVLQKTDLTRSTWSPSNARQAEWKLEGLHSTHLYTMVLKRDSALQKPSRHHVIPDFQASTTTEKPVGTWSSRAAHCTRAGSHNRTVTRSKSGQKRVLTTSQVENI